MASEVETMKADVQERLQFQFNYWQNMTTNIMFNLQINTGKMHTC